MFEEEREYFMTQPDGYMSPYTTISYANGPGFLVHFTGNDRRPWKDVSKDFEKPIHEDIDFKQPSMWRGPGTVGQSFQSLKDFKLHLYSCTD